MISTITTSAMATYWSRQVARLESMRPLTAAEAMAAAEQWEREAADLDRAVIEAESCPRESGRLAERESGRLAERDARNLRALGDARRAVWGYRTRAQQARMRAESLRRVAAHQEGQDLAQALAEARRRAAHYTALAAAE